MPALPKNTVEMKVWLKRVRSPQMGRFFSESDNEPVFRNSLQMNEAALTARATSELNKGPFRRCSKCLECVPHSTRVSHWPWIPPVKRGVCREEWQSGRMRRFAKSVMGSNPSAGSNPVSSAQTGGMLLQVIAGNRISPCHGRGFCRFFRVGAIRCVRILRHSCAGFRAALLARWKSSSVTWR